MKKTMIYMMICGALLTVSDTVKAQNRNTHYFQDNSAGTNSYFSGREPLLAYPNPATHSVTVTLPYTSRQVVDVLVMDYNGTVLRNYRFAAGGQSYSMDVSFLEKGQYVLHVHEGGAATGIVKLVKDR